MKGYIMISPKFMQSDIWKKGTAEESALVFVLMMKCDADYVVRCSKKELSRSEGYEVGPCLNSLEKRGYLNVSESGIKLNSLITKYFVTDGENPSKLD